jgi:hypothetical protein
MAPEVPTPARPGWLTTLAFVGVALGGLGIVGGIQQLVGARTSVAESEQEVTRGIARFPGMASQPKEVGDAIKAAIPGMVQVDLRWKKRRVALASANILLSAILLVGALQSMRLLGSGRWLWINACLALFPVEILAALVRSLFLRDMTQVWVEALVKAGDVPQAAAKISGPSKVAVSVVAVLYGTWALLLCVYYAITLVQLTRPSTKQLFAAATVEHERDDQE